MTPPSTRLDIWFNDELAGSVHDMSPLGFEYASDWLNRRPPMSLASINFQADIQQTLQVQAFFENLLPEGDLRAYIAEQKKASTLFALLLEAAGDTAGSFVITPHGQRPEAASYEATSWQWLGERLKTHSIAALDLHGKGARISLAGAQDKTSIAIFEGTPMLPRGTSPSTHILKPDIHRLAQVWESAANEAITMAAAAECGLPTAEVFYEAHTRSCAVKRFDRVVHPNGSLGRLIQYDFCQLSGTTSEKKYEKEGGPGVAACAAIIRKYSSRPAVDLRNFVAWIFFNLYTGNNDSHAKNLSVYYTPESGVGLTPFYDLMCTRLYPGLSQEFAFAIGGEVLPGNMRAENIMRMAAELGMRPHFVSRIGQTVAREVPAALKRAIDTLAPSFTPAAKTLAERLEAKVLSLTRQTAARLFALNIPD